MDTKTYYKKKKEINDNKKLSDRQKEVLLIDLRHSYFGIDRRASLDYMDGTAVLKPGIIKVIDEKIL